MGTFYFYSWFGQFSFIKLWREGAYVLVFLGRFMPAVSDFAFRFFLYKSNNGTFVNWIFQNLFQFKRKIFLTDIQQRRLCNLFVTFFLFTFTHNSWTDSPIFVLFLERFTEGPVTLSLDQMQLNRAGIQIDNRLNKQSYGLMYATHAYRSPSSFHVLYGTSNDLQ